jgi:hypothetical protein
MAFQSAIPSLPVLDISASAWFYRDTLGMLVRYQEADFAILVKDSVEIHLWAANKPDVKGRSPSSPARRPVAYWWMTSRISTCSVSRSRSCIAMVRWPESTTASMNSP